MEDQFETICNGWEEEALASLTSGAAAGDIGDGLLRMCGGVVRQFGGGNAHLKRCVDIHLARSAGEKVERFGY